LELPSSGKGIGTADFTFMNPFPRTQLSKIIPDSEQSGRREINFQRQLATPGALWQLYEVRWARYFYFLPAPLPETDAAPLTEGLDALPFGGASFFGFRTSLPLPVSFSCRISFCLLACFGSPNVRGLPVSSHPSQTLSHPRDISILTAARRSVYRYRRGLTGAVRVDSANRVPVGKASCYYCSACNALGGAMTRFFAGRLLAAMLAPAFSGPAVSAAVDDAKAAYMRHDYATAARLTRPLAQRGDADARAKLGELYRRGLGVNQSLLEAARWYRLAATQGNARAQNNLGLMYYYMGKPGGNGEDFVRAYMWYDVAAAAKNPEAVINLKAAAALLMPAQIARAREMARKCRASQFKSCG
jgi:hypothetical protein